MKYKFIHQMICFLISFFLSLTMSAQSGSGTNFYSLSMNTIDGAAISPVSLQGKKVMTVVLPLTANDTSLAKPDLLSLCQSNSNLIVLGVPAIEYGYSASSKNEIKSMYSSFPSNFILTEGMYVQKESSQSSLFQWLTDRNKNLHFDQDVQGVGHKFFIDEGGDLYSVLNAKIKLSHQAISRAISRVRPQ